MQREHGGRRGLSRRTLRSIGLACLLALGLIPSAAIASNTICSDLAPLEPALARLVPRIESFVLDNGLRVHLVPRPHDRSVSVRVAYDVGARDEAPGRGGLAHLFEHMMFKGSARIPDGGHFRIVRDVGGETNAMTDYDTTQYWSNVPRTGLDRVLFAEADRMRSLRLSATNLDNQRAAIREEGLGLENLPYVAAAADFGLRLWAGTDYGHSPLGTPEELAAVTPEDARAFHARWYAPANAVLVVAGGFEVGAARRAIEQAFASIPSGPPPPPRPPVQLADERLRVVADDPLAPFPVYAFVWHAVGADHPDAPALEVLADLLMGHPDARFDRGVAEPFALDAYALPVTFRDVGLLNHVFVPRTFVGFRQIRRAVAAESEALRRDGPAPAELCRSIARTRGARLEGLVTGEGAGAAVAQGALLHRDPRAFARRLQAIEALDPESLRAVADRHLDDGFHTLVIRPAGAMRWLKPLLEWLPDGVGASIEEGLL